MRVLDSSLRSGGALSETRPTAEGIYVVGALVLVREFVDRVLARSAHGMIGDAHTPRHPVDWALIEASVSDCRSLEQAIGRALVIADQMCRGVFEYTHHRVAEPTPTIRDESTFATRDDDPFFAFSMADAVPDFGDESRYRTKVARKVARVFGVQRTMVTRSVAS